MDLRGKGDWNNQNLIVRIPVDPVMGKDGKEIKGKFVEVQADHSNYNPVTVAKGTNKVKEGALPPQRNPYLNSKKVEGKDGNTFLSNDALYTLPQVEKIVAAAAMLTLEHSLQPQVRNMTCMVLTQILYWYTKVIRRNSRFL